MSFRFSTPGVLLIYLLLAGGVGGALLAMYLMPRRALAIDLVNAEGKAVLVYDGASTPAGCVYYRDRRDDFVVYVGDQVNIHPKADWFRIIIRR